MKHYHAALTAALAVCALVLAVFLLAPSDPPQRGPRDVMGAFVYHLDRGNFGKACGLMSDEARGPLENCSAGFVYNAGVNMVFIGLDIFDGATLLPGVTEVDGKYVFRLKTDSLPPVKVTVAKTDSGRYRIVKIG